MARRWLRFEIPSRRGTIPARNGRRAGSVIIARTDPLQSAAGIRGKVHPPSKARRVAGADSVRRRLSIIFQRPINGIALRAGWPLESRPRPRIHGRSCQSPRAQR